MSSAILADGAPAPAPSSKLGAVLRVTSGNFLEQFDFFLFGFYATSIAHAFFPTSSDFASLMLTFAVFGAGFLMRPLGAIVLGAYIDEVGRRKGLIVTLVDHGQRHGADRLRAGLCLDRPARARAGAARPAAAGLLRRRRTGRRLGLPVGDGHARPQGLLHGLAVGQPAGGDRAGRGAGLRAQRAVDARGRWAPGAGASPSSSAA